MSEAGSVTLWLLGLCVALLFLAGLSLDLWRVFNARRELVGLADAAGVVGAGAVDEDVYRARSVVRLDPADARRRATGYLRRALPRGARAQLRATTGAITVRLSRDVRLSLLGIFVTGQAVPVHASATVMPRRAP